MIKVGVVQQPPVYLNKTSSLERAVDLITEAASAGCKMVVFPEAWLPGYPECVWRLAPGNNDKQTKVLFALSQENSVDLGRDDLAPLKEVAKEYSVVIVMGHQEIDGSVSGSTLYNSVAIIDADGRLRNNHRKLMPTCPERMVWGSVMARPYRLWIRRSVAWGP